MPRLAVYNTLKTAVSSGSQREVSTLLSRENIHDIHDYFCEKPSAAIASACVRCDELLRTPLQQRDTDMIRLLLKHRAYPPAEICVSEHRYSHRDKPLTPLKLAVESGSIDDVRKLLSAGADVNVHPRMCVKFVIGCTDCDTPLMAAVRREDVAMIRLLIAHGASVSEAVHSDDECKLDKTALHLAARAGNEEVMTELVTSGADVNQVLGLNGTVCHEYWENDKVANILVRLGADPNSSPEIGISVFCRVLHRGDVYRTQRLDLVLQSLSLLLPATRNLDDYLQENRAAFLLNINCTMLVLQHGARIDYSDVFLTESAQWRRMFGDKCRYIKKHSEQFIDLLRAADTDFSGVRQRIASLDRKKWKVLNLPVLEDKLSQPLTLQTSCVISVRRRLLSISDVQLWARIDALTLPATIRDLLKLIVW